MKFFPSDEEGQRRGLMDTIFREHFSAVQRYISTLVKQPDLVDDLTSIVFLKAFRWLQEDRGVGQVRSWLYATARTTVADYWQQQQKNLCLPLEEIEESAMILLEPQQDKQTQNQVYHLLHLLPERERQVLILRYFQGYSAAEVGQELGLHAGHVRVLQLRALRRAALLDAKERESSLMNESTNQPATTYTEQGQRVLDLAQAEALSFHHYYLGSEHLLLGILGEGSAATLLTTQGATLLRVRAELLRMIGQNEPGPRTDTPLTPRSQQILTVAGEIAGQIGLTAIAPEQILQAVVGDKEGIAAQMLYSIGVDLAHWQAKQEKQSEQEREQYILKLESKIAQYPQLDEEEELRLAHLIGRGKSEQRRAELLNETPDPDLLEQGDTAFFQLNPASQHLVLSVAQEYFEPTRDSKEIMSAGNSGLSLALITFGSKKQTSFRTYAKHMIHLQIIKALG